MIKLKRGMYKYYEKSIHIYWWNYFAYSLIPIIQSATDFALGFMDKKKTKLFGEGIAPDEKKNQIGFIVEEEQSYNEEDE